LPIGQGTYITDVDETTPNGSIVCQNLTEIVTTVRDAYAIVRAGSWILKHYPRVP
jgi:hypothetical protein